MSESNRLAPPALARFARFGSGRDLLLLGDAGFAPDVMCDLRESLVSTHRSVVTFDYLPPTGAPAFAIKDTVLALAEGIERIGLAEPCVVGIGLGAQLAVELALIGAPISKLVLLGPRCARSQMTNLLFDAFASALDIAMSPQEREMLFAPWDLTSALLSEEPRLRRVVEFRASRRLAPSVHAAQLAAMKEYDAFVRVRGVEKQTLVLVGAEDATTLPADAQGLAHQLPRGRFRLLARGGHGLWQEYARSCADAISAFLDAHE